MIEHTKTVLKQLNNPKPNELGNSVNEFLKILDQPTCIIQDGLDNSRSRVIVTLQHGNEPSGVMALWRWLKSNEKPAVQIVMIIASVNTALQQPMFHYRHLPGERDLNRCYKAPFGDEAGQLAKGILDNIYQAKPEAVVDMHNTSGSSPAFGVATHIDEKHEIITAIFTERLIITHLKLGALMDISELHYPTVTIEVGGRLEEQAHQLAYDGLRRFFLMPEVFKKNSQTTPIQLLIEPIRLKIKPNLSLTYAKTQNSEFDVVLKEDIDQQSFVVQTSPIHIGWVNNGGLNNFAVEEPIKGTSTVPDWLMLNDQGELFLHAGLQAFMLTTNPVIASEDCLFYATKNFRNVETTSNSNKHNNQ